MQVTRRPTSTTASTTSESGAALSILMVVASLSGNTRELGRQIAERRAAGHAVHWHEADDLRQAPPLAADEADLVLLGCWTDNAGRTPVEMKAWVAGIAERGEHPGSWRCSVPAKPSGGRSTTAAPCIA